MAVLSAEIHYFKEEKQTFCQKACGDMPAKYDKYHSSEWHSPQ